MCRSDTTVGFSSSCHDVYKGVNDSNDKTYSIEQRHQIMVVNMLYNWNRRYSSHYRIIKYISSQTILYAINLDNTSYSKVFSEFDSMLLSNALLVSINKIISI